MNPISSAPTSATFIPKFWRRAISTSLLLLSTSMTYWGLIAYHSHQIPTLNSIIELGKIVAGASGAWLFFMFSSTTIEHRHILGKIEDFLTKTIPDRVATIRITSKTTSRDLIENHNNAMSHSPARAFIDKQDIDFRKGDIFCFYKIRANCVNQGDPVVLLEFLLQCNVHQLVLVCFLPTEYADRYTDTLKITIEGPQKFGWQFSYYGLKEDVRDNSKKNCELAFQILIEDEVFVFNSSKTLYYANDIASLLRSLIIEIGRDRLM